MFKINFCLALMLMSFHSLAKMGENANPLYKCARKIVEEKRYNKEVIDELVTILSDSRTQQIAPLIKKCEVLMSEASKLEKVSKKMRAEIFIKDNEQENSNSNSSNTDAIKEVLEDIAYKAQGCSVREVDIDATSGVGIGVAVGAGNCLSVAGRRSVILGLTGGLNAGVGAFVTYGERQLDDLNDKHRFGLARGFNAGWGWAAKVTTANDGPFYDGMGGGIGVNVFVDKTLRIKLLTVDREDFRYFEQAIFKGYHFLINV